MAALLRDARTRAGLTQRELARRARTTQSVVGRIEAELVSPSLETMQRLLAGAGFTLQLELRPLTVADATIEAYKADIDRTLLRENLKKTPEQRVRALQAHLRLATEARRAGRALRARA
jgi:transcriptional regulator with XRE-family HTH domain